MMNACASVTASMLATCPMTKGIESAKSKFGIAKETQTTLQKCKITSFPLDCDSAIEQRLLENQGCVTCYFENQFLVSANARLFFNRVTLKATFIKNK